jgi:hypothetical protein
MKTSIGYLLFITSLLSILSCGQTDNRGGSNTFQKYLPENYCKKLDGNVFQYNGKIFSYKDEKSDPDSIAFYIKFNCQADTIKGVMLGPDPEGDEGLYFFKENLDSIRIDSGYISFSLVERTLYQRPFPLNNYENFSNVEAGRSNDRQFFKGKLDGDSIVFSCQSPAYQCYEDTMVFRKRKHN